jgi:hypothetical protein
MKSFHGFVNRERAKVGSPASSNRRWGGSAALSLVLVAVAVCLNLTCPAFGQVVPSADAGGLSVSAGATASGYYLQYGERQMLGVTGFVDVDTRRRMGFEGEAQFIQYHQTEGLHASLYTVGPRYHFNVGRFQPYLKAMAGLGEFDFPFPFPNGPTTGSYLVVVGGGGIDYRLTLRVANAEYQSWPQFGQGSGNLTTLGVSTGLRVRIF